MKRKITVLTGPDGRVLGTHAPAVNPNARGTPQFSARIVAPKGHTVHEIEFDVPTSMKTSAEVDAFHKKVRSHLGTKHR